MTDRPVYLPYRTILQQLQGEVYKCLDTWLRQGIILDVIKYCDHPRWYKKIPPGGGTSNWRWDLQLEVTPPIRVGPLIGGVTSDWRWDLQLEVTSPIRVGPLIRGGTSNQR